LRRTRGINEVIAVAPKAYLLVHIEQN
jgi:hypothetical protein